MYLNIFLLWNIHAYVQFGNTDTYYSLQGMDLNENRFIVPLCACAN
jgi:hypothetical protein